MKKSRFLPLFSALSVLIAALFFYILFLNYYQGLIFPGIKVSSNNVGSLPATEAQEILTGEYQNKINKPLILSYQDKTFALNLNDATPGVDYEKALNQAYLIGRSGNFWRDARNQFHALIYGYNISPELNFRKKSSLDLQINYINSAIKTDPVNAKIIPGGKVTIIPSQNGQELNSSLLLKQISNYLTLNYPAPLAIPLKTKAPKFNTQRAEKAKAALENISHSPIKLHYQNNSWVIDQEAMLNLLDFNDSPEVLSLDLPDHQLIITNLNIDEVTATSEKLVVSPEKLTAYLKNLSDKIDQEAQDARFVMDSSTMRVKEFQSAKDGKKLDIDHTAKLLTEALRNDSARDITLPVAVTKPKVTASKANNLGIEKLLGEGLSYFAGSIDNRIYNIGLAASRINGILVPPGETFSFLNAVGDISAASGYKQAYVIKSGRTVLDDGGGVCQVSTTLFRAILNSGLPVVKRTAHAYRVGYYEQGGFLPGLDATVFSPGVDFQFKNDTPNYILIQSTMGSTSLTFDIYGTDDGRVTAVTKPKIANQTPPPPELRQDDPSLPKGTVKQVDWAAWGANVEFKRTVSRGAETLISETYKSNFRPWQAIYLVGTKE